MKKQSSMNLFLLFQAVFFAASVYANPGTHKVLVAEVKGEYHHLSLVGAVPFRSPIDSNQLVWGNPLSVPVMVAHSEDNTLKVLGDISRHVVISRRGVVVLGTDSRLHKTEFRFNSKKILTNPVFFSCPNEKYHTLQTEENIKAGYIEGCEKTKIHMSSFNPETGIVTLPSDGKKAKTLQLLSVPEKAPIALFANVDKVWRPITVDFAFSEMDNLELVYDNPNQFPIEFDFQNGQLVSSIESLPGFLCIERSKLYLNSEECSKKMSFVSNSSIAFKEQTVCYGGNEKLYCLIAEIQLFYLDRKTNTPITNKLIEIPPAKPDSKSDREAYCKSKKHENKSSKQPSETPEHLRVFAVKNGDSFTPLALNQITSIETVLDYGKIKNPPKFEYSNGIATTNDTKTPGNVVIDSTTLAFGTFSGTPFTIDENGKVNHEFYRCEEVRHRFTSLFSRVQDAEYYKCKPETVYFLPHNKVIRTVKKC